MSLVTAVAVVHQKLNSLMGEWVVWLCIIAEAVSSALIIHRREQLKNWYKSTPVIESTHIFNDENKDTKFINVMLM